MLAVWHGAFVAAIAAAVEVFETARWWPAAVILDAQGVRQKGLFGGEVLWQNIVAITRKQSLPGSEAICVHGNSGKSLRIDQTAHPDASKIANSIVSELRRRNCILPNTFEEPPWERFHRLIAMVAAAVLAYSLFLRVR